MKTFKKYHQEFMLVYLPILVILGVFATFFPKLINFVFFLNAVFLVLLIITFFSPLKAYHAKIPSVPLKKYIYVFLKMTFLQIVLVFLAINFNLIVFKIMPSHYASYYSNIQSVTLIQSLFLDSKHFFLWGFFPWSAILFIGISFIIYKNLFPNVITLRQVTYPVIKKQKDKFLDVGIELFLRHALVISSGIIAMLFGLSIYFYAVALGMPRIEFKPSGYTVISYLLIFPIISSRFWKSFIKKLWLRNYTTLQLLLLQITFTVLALLILTVILNWLGNTVGVDLGQNYDFPMPHLNIAFAWTLLKWSFWTAFIVFLSFQLASFAQGINIRALIIMGLIWPLLFLLFTLHHSSHLYLKEFYIYLETPEVSLAFNLVLLIFISLFFGFNKNFETLLMQYYYQEKASKQKRYPLKMLNNNLRIMSLFFLLYIFSGINLLSLLLFGMIATCYVIYTVGVGLGLIKSLWLKN